MNILVFSDIHGSEKAAKIMEKAIQKFSPERIILLGDILQHEEGEVASVIRKYSGMVIAVEGNCDYAPNDKITLNIEMPRYCSYVIEGHTVHMSHVCQFVSFPPGDVVMYGHTHVKDLHKENGVTYFNPGSIALPRDECASFGLIEGKTIKLIHADSFQIIKELDI